MNGKSKCKILREIRKEIAKNNDIEFVTSECKYQGDCLGTCPKCEQEVRYLEAELLKRKQLGKSIAVAGLAAAMVASAIGCSNSPTGNDDSSSVSDSSVTTTESSSAVNLLTSELIKGEIPEFEVIPSYEVTMGLPPSPQRPSVNWFDFRLSQEPDSDFFAAMYLKYKMGSEKYGDYSEDYLSHYTRNQLKKSWVNHYVKTINNGCTDIYDILDKKQPFKDGEMLFIMYNSDDEYVSFEVKLDKPVISSASAAPSSSDETVVSDKGNAANGNE